MQFKVGYSAIIITLGTFVLSSCATWWGSVGAVDMVLDGRAESVEIQPYGLLCCETNVIESTSDSAHSGVTDLLVANVEYTLRFRTVPSGLLRSEPFEQRLTEQSRLRIAPNPDIQLDDTGTRFHLIPTALIDRESVTLSFVLDDAADEAEASNIVPEPVTFPARLRRDTIYIEETYEGLIEFRANNGEARHRHVRYREGVRTSADGAGTAARGNDIDVFVSGYNASGSAIDDGAQFMFVVLTVHAQQFDWHFSDYNGRPWFLVDSVEPVTRYYLFPATQTVSLVSHGTHGPHGAPHPSHAPSASSSSPPRFSHGPGRYGSNGGRGGDVRVFHPPGLSREWVQERLSVHNRGGHAGRGGPGSIIWARQRTESESGVRFYYTNEGRERSGSDGSPGRNGSVSLIEQTAEAYLGVEYPVWLDTDRLTGRIEHADGAE